MKPRIMAGWAVVLAGLVLAGPKVRWSHYGPLDLCISEEELKVAT